jgi:ABC-2 type transport system permease protein
VCLIAGFRPQHWLAIPAAFIFVGMIALVFAALGTTIGSLIKDMQGFQLVMNFMLLPLFFLSGALYPLNNLPKALSAVTRIDPMSYGVDGLRGALTGVWHFNFVLDLGVLLCLAAVFLCTGAYFFSRIEA